MQPYEPIRFPDFIEEKFHGKAPLTGDYIALTAREARTYFAWFQETMPQRIEYLLNYCSAEMGISISELRIFPDGFLPLWKWFRIHQTLRRSTPEEIADMERKYGFLGESWIMKEVLDELTERLHFDIGMFFGDQFVKALSDGTELVVLFNAKERYFCEGSRYYRLWKVPEKGRNDWVECRRTRSPCRQ